MLITYTYGDTLVNAVNTIKSTSHSMSSLVCSITNGPVVEWFKKLINIVAPIFPDVSSHYQDLERAYDGRLFQLLIKYFEGKLVPGLPNLITLGVVSCCFCMMATGNISKWGGRAMMIFWIGAGLILIFK